MIATIGAHFEHEPIVSFEVINGSPVITIKDGPDAIVERITVFAPNASVSRLHNAVAAFNTALVREEQREAAE